MKKSLLTILHISFWLLYFLIVAMVMFAALQGETFQPGDTRYYTVFILGVGIVPPMLSFYGHHLYLFPRYLQKRKIAQTVFMSIVLSTLATFAGFFVIQLGSSTALACVRSGFPYAFGFTFGLSTLMGVVSLVLKGFLTWFEELKMKEELLEKNHRMEMALVKSQLDPHFLFNTINNIDVLIEKDANQASFYLKKLSDIMRFMLYQTKGEKIHLKEELAYIEKYIELQKIRTGNKNYVNYQVDGKVNGQQIAPMIFIPYIENAFKHSHNKKWDNAVNISIHVQEEMI
ncbi:MAG: histidine kinase, partial [Bacteroidota bacterium]